MVNTDHKNEAEPNHEELEVKSTLAWWQEWGIILLTLVLFLIAPLCCIILGHIHRNRAWAEKVRAIGYVVLIPHLLISVIFLCGVFQLYGFIIISVIILFLLPLMYLVTGFSIKISGLKSVLLKVGSVTLILSIATAAIIIPQILGERRSAWENRCRLTLRSLGSAQLVYQDLSHNNNYGTWEELSETDHIPEGFTRTNLIDNYSIVVFIVHKSTFDEKGNSNSDSTFSIVAIPRSVMNRLRTFSIGDDQTPRVWVGKSEEWSTENVSLRNKDLWEPIR